MQVELDVVPCKDVKGMFLVVDDANNVLTAVKSPINAANVLCAVVSGFPQQYVVKRSLFELYGYDDIADIRVLQCIGCLEDMLEQYMEFREQMVSLVRAKSLDVKRPSDVVKAFEGEPSQDVMRSAAIWAFKYYGGLVVLLPEDIRELVDRWFVERKFDLNAVVFGPVETNKSCNVYDVIAPTPSVRVLVDITGPRKFTAQVVAVTEESATSFDVVLNDKIAAESRYHSMHENREFSHHAYRQEYARRMLEACTRFKNFVSAL